MMLAIIGLASYGQTLYRPVQPYNESGYTVQAIENFASKPTKLSWSFRYMQLAKVNQFLEKTGQSKDYNGGNPLDEAWIAWLCHSSRTWPEDRIYPNGFWNSHQNERGDSVVPYWDKNYFRGPVLVLHLGGYELDLCKIICMNDVNVPFTQKNFTVPKQKDPTEGLISEKPAPAPVATPFVPAKTITTADIIAAPTPGQTDLNLNTKTEDPSWLSKNGGWLKPVAIGLLTLAGGFIAHDNEHSWYFWGTGKTNSHIVVDDSGGK